MIFTEQTEQFIKDDINLLMSNLDHTIERLNNMKLYYQDILEALN